MDSQVCWENLIILSNCRHMFDMNHVYDFSVNGKSDEENGIFVRLALVAMCSRDPATNKNCNTLVLHLCRSQFSIKWKVKPCPENWSLNNTPSTLSLSYVNNFVVLIRSCTFLQHLFASEQREELVKKIIDTAMSFVGIQIK